MHTHTQDQRIRLVALAAAFVFSLAALQSASFGRLSASVGYQPVATGGIAWMASQAPDETMNRMMMVAPSKDAVWHGAPARHTMVRLDPSSDIMMELKELPGGVIGMRVHRAAANPDPTGFHAAASHSGWLDVVLGVFDAK
jgi:hypothetical protein